MVGSVEEGVVEGKKDSWLCEPGDANSNLGVDGRDEGRSGAESLGMARRPNVDVGGIETGEEGRTFRSGGGPSMDVIEDSSFHVRDSAGSVAVKVNFVSGLVERGDLSARATVSLRLLASLWASLRVEFELE